MDDAILLQRYVRERCEEAFASLVHRHLDLVYGAALRRLNGNRHAAEDATQLVFVALARKAPRLLSHTSLTGWLHVAARNAAASIIRTEQRLAQRHLAATHCLPDQSDLPDAVRAEPMIPDVIDQALEELNERDRSAVLLRYLQGKPYAEVAKALHTTEDAARRRTDRALEKLRTRLARLGIASTGAALSAALAHANTAAPAGLAAKVAPHALLAGQAAAGGIVGTFIAMKSLKGAITLATAAALVTAVGVAVSTRARLVETQAALATTQAELGALQQSLRERAVPSSPAAQPAATPPAPTTPTSAPGADNSGRPGALVGVTRAEVDRRYKAARAHFQAGRHDEALREFLWCYDTGMPQVSAFSGVRVSFLLGQLEELSRVYPPALHALQDRLAAVKSAMEADPTDSGTTRDFAALCRVLKNESEALSYLKRLPPDDPRRTPLGRAIYPQLVQSQNYAEAASLYSFSEILASFDRAVANFSRVRDTKRGDAALEDAATGHVRSTTVPHIEVLLAQGELENARLLGAMMLGFDNSPSTRAQIQEAANRAGRPDFLSQLPSL